MNGGIGSALGGPQDGLAHNASSPRLHNEIESPTRLIAGVPLNDDVYSTFDPFKRSSHRLNNKLTSSIQEAAQM